MTSCRQADEHKVKDDTWLTGEGLQGYWTGAVGTAEQPGRAYYGWYQDFLSFMLRREWHTWFADLIAWGEVLVGLGLIVGALVGIAAFFGTVMNVSFLLARSTSSNPIMFGLSALSASSSGAKRRDEPVARNPRPPNRSPGATSVRGKASRL